MKALSPFSDECANGICLLDDTKAGRSSSWSDADIEDRSGILLVSERCM